MSNPPLFPDLEGYVSTKGPKVTLRDLFAGMAMSQMCRNGDDAEATAHYSYEYADAMLKEREKVKS